MYHRAKYVFLQKWSKWFHEIAGQIWPYSLPCKVMEPLLFAGPSYGAYVQSPAELWSNETFALQTHGDIVSGAKVTTYFI